VWAAANSYTAGMTERKIKIFSSGIRSIVVRGKVQWSHHRRRGATIGPRWLSTNDSSQQRSSSYHYYFFLFHSFPDRLRWDRLTDNYYYIFNRAPIVYNIFERTKGYTIYYYTRGGAISLCDGVYYYHYRHRYVYIFCGLKNEATHGAAVSDDSAYILYV